MGSYAAGTQLRNKQVSELEDNQSQFPKLKHKEEKKEMNIKNCTVVLEMWHICTWNFRRRRKNRREDIFEVMISANSPNLMTDPASSGNTNQYKFKNK